VRTLPEVKPQQMTGFRDYLNLESQSPPPTSTAQGYDPLNSREQSFSLLDNSLSWPVGNQDLSFLVSGSPIRGSPVSGTPVKATDSRSNTNTPVRGQGQVRESRDRQESRGEQNRASDNMASIRGERPEAQSPYRELGSRSVRVHERDRSWSPPRYMDRLSPQGRMRSRQLPQRRDSDTLSLPDLSLRTLRYDTDKGLDPTVHKVKVIKVTSSSAMPVSTILSTISDSSSTVTSAMTTPVPTHRDPREVTTPRSDPMTLNVGRIGQSPPVRDSGSSLTTVTSLTDQHIECTDQRGQNDNRDGHLSFDLGFLDILTVDSNSSVADQLSTGRVSYWGVGVCVCIC